MRTFVALASIVLAACYGARDADEPQANTENSPKLGAAGMAPQAGTWNDERGMYPPKGSPSPPAPRSGGSGGVSGGAGGCAAFRTPANNMNYIDQDAFSGIGGAGAMLAGTCQRCGWNAYGDMCQTLVASVPTIGNPNYYTCLDLSLAFSDCLEVESCVCGGKVPARCAAIKAKQDACLNGASGVDTDGGVDTTAAWMDVETSCGFGFQAPADYRNTPVQGTDSCVLQFTTASCDFFADYGWYSGGISPNPGDQNYRSEATQAGGRPATIATYTTSDPMRYAAAIHVPQVSMASPAVKLTMVALCKTEAGQSDALALFGTLRFD